MITNLKVTFTAETHWELTRIIAAHLEINPGLSPIRITYSPIEVAATLYGNLKPPQKGDR